MNHSQVWEWLFFLVKASGEFYYEENLRNLGDLSHRSHRLHKRVFPSNTVKFHHLIPSSENSLAYEPLWASHLFSLTPWQFPGMNHFKILWSYHAEVQNCPRFNFNMRWQLTLWTLGYKVKIQKKQSTHPDTSFSSVETKITRKPLFLRELQLSNSFHSCVSRWVHYLSASTFISTSSL